MADRRDKLFLLRAIFILASFFCCISFTTGCKAKDINQDYLPRRIRVENFTAICLYGNHQVVLHKLWSSVKVSLLSLKGSKIERNFIHANSCEAVHNARETNGLSRFIFALLPSVSSAKYRASEIQFSPFTNVCFGVEPDEELEDPVIVHIKLIGVHWWFPVMFTIGLLLFSYSDKLSRNVMFFYSSGISVGMVASLLIAVLLLSRLIPRRNLAYLSLAGGWSLTLAGLTWILKNFWYLVQQYYEWFVGYLAIAGLISFVVCYYYGPPKDERRLDLICWFIQLVALVLLYKATQSKEVSLALVIIVFLSKFINFNKALRCLTTTALLRWLPYKLQYKLFLPKHRFLTEDEYNHQARLETIKALDDLRQYCSSPECDTWKTVSRLKSPGRFAEFVSTGKHFHEEEIRYYEFADENSLSKSLFTEFEDSEPEEEIPAYSYLDGRT